MLKSELLTCFEEDSITTQIYDSKTFYLAKLEDQKYIKNAEFAACNLKKYFKWSDF